MRSKSEELMLRIREYIESYFERYSSTPTVREIAGAMKIAVSSAHRYLVAMAEKDMVFYENGTLSTPKIHRRKRKRRWRNTCPCPCPSSARGTSTPSGPPAAPWRMHKSMMATLLSSASSIPPRLGRSSLPSPMRTRTR